MVYKYVLYIKNVFQHLDKGQLVVNKSITMLNVLPIKWAKE